MSTMSQANLATLKALKDSEDVEILGVTYLRLDGDFGPEWKASPFGYKGDYDKDCYWLDEEDLADEVNTRQV